MNPLANYIEVKNSIAKLVKFDEVTDIIDKSAALNEYARRAKDPELIGHAVEVRMWAERRLGEMIAELREAGELAKGGQPHQSIGVSKTPVEPTLAERGINKNLAKRARLRMAIPEDQFAAAIEDATAMQVALFEGDKAVIEAIRAAKNKGKKEKREAKEKDLATKITALPDKKFGVILADPPWKFEFFSDAGANYAGPENHYPLLSTEDIMALPVADIAADDCILFLWATAPMIIQALDVMEAWGFTYKSQFVWVKHKAATGFWSRGRHELLLLGTKGKVPAPAPGDAWESVIEAAARKHSQKPDKVYDLIERYFPTLPKIELNARGQPREGWESWGPEAEKIPSWLLSGSANPERLHDEAKN